MTDPILVLAIGASVLAALSFILARLIPDEYDRAGLKQALAVRRRSPTPHR